MVLLRRSGGRIAYLTAARYASRNGRARPAVLASEMQRWSFARVTSLFLTVGLAGVILPSGIATVLDAHQSTAWPTVDGTVSASSMRYHRSSGKGGPYYEPELSYRYVVNGREYVAHQIAFRPLNSSRRSKVSELMAPYQVGAVVTVHYDAQNPGTAVLQPGSDLDSWTEVIVGSLFLLAGLAIVFVTPNLRRSRP